MTWDEIKNQRQSKSASGAWDEIVKSRGGSLSQAATMNEQPLSGARARHPTGVSAPQPPTFSPLLQEQMAKAGTRDVELRNKVITPEKDNDPDWLNNFQTGHPVLGTLGLVSSPLNMVQSGIMNTSKNILNVTQGKPLSWKGQYNYTNYLNDVNPENNFIKKANEVNPILGSAVQMGAEIISDPLTWIGGGFIDDALKAGAKKVGSAAYDINKVVDAGKLPAKTVQAIPDPNIKTATNANASTINNLIPQKIALPEGQNGAVADFSKSPIKADLTRFDESVLSDFNTARKSYIQYAQSNFPRSVVNTDTGIDISISRDGLDKLLSGDITKEKYASAFHIPELIQNAKKVGEAPYAKNKANIFKYTYFDSPISIGNKNYNAYIRVRETNMGNKYYGHTLGVVDDIKIEPSARGYTDESALHSVYASGSIEPSARSYADKSALHLVNDASGSINNSMLPAPQNVNANIGVAQAAPSKVVTQNVDIPKGYKERGYSESIRTKADLPEAVKQEFADNPAFYKQLSNKTTKESADAIFAQGAPKARSDFDILLKQKDPRALPLGNSLAKEYMAQGDREGAVSVLRQMAEELTKSGQFSQAAAINLMKNDPLTAMTYIERQLDRINAEGVKKYGKHWSDFSLNDSEKALFSGAAPGDESAIKNAFETVGSRIARQYPSTIGEKVVELSRISMLLNPKTQVRNVVSNTFLLPIRQFSDKLSALGQNAYALVDPNFKPTQAFMVNKEAKTLSGEIWNSVKENLLGVDKWEQDVTLGIKNKEIFKMGKLSPTSAVNAILPKSKQLEKPMLEYARELTYSLLEKGDSPFVKKNFTDRLASYIQAQGIKNFADVPQEAIDIATSEALKATFKDDNALTQVLSAMKRKTGIVGEAVMPFTKTPANIAMRGIDYSPAGIATAIHQYAKGGNNPALLIDNLSKAAVGTGGIWLGIALAQKGIITGAQNDNKNIAAFDRAQGKIPYSIKAGGRYYSYDWSQPAAIPLIIGTALYDASQKQDEAVSGILNGTFNAASAAGDQFLNLSPLQNIKDIIGGYGSPSEKVMQTVAEFPQRLIPSVVGATSRVIDPKARQAYSANNFQKSQIDEYQSKFPELSKLLPANIDVWGREINRLPAAGQRAVQEYVSPSAIGVQNITPVDKEIERLYQATSDTGIIPKKAEWTREYKGLKYSLTSTEWTKYQTTLGKTSKNVLDSMVSLTAYKTLPDGQKSTAVQKTYDYAQEKSKIDYFASKGVLYAVPKSVEKADGAQNAGISLADYFTTQAAISNMDTDKDKNGESVSGSLKKKVVEYINSLGLSREQKKYLIEAQGYDVPLLLR